MTSFARLCKEVTKDPDKRNENGQRTAGRIQEVTEMNGFGHNFDDFMVEQGLYDEAKELAAKKLVVLALKQEMEAQNLSKSNIGLV